MDGQRTEGFVADETVLSGVRVQQQTHVPLPGPLRASGRPGGMSLEDEESFRRMTYNEGQTPGIAVTGLKHLGVLPLRAEVGKRGTGDKPCIGQPPQTQESAAGTTRREEERQKPPAPPAPGLAVEGLHGRRQQDPHRRGLEPPALSAAPWSPLTAAARPSPPGRLACLSVVPSPAGRPPGLRAEPRCPPSCRRLSFCFPDMVSGPHLPSVPTGACSRGAARSR